MARPQKCRHICSIPAVTSYIPEGVPDCGTIVMGYDEYETLRLLDYEQYSQEECAEKMQVARTTVTRMYENARQKLADALVHGKRLVIGGGDVIVCAAPKPECAGSPGCCHNNKMRGTGKMKIAVTFENGEVFQHFGHTEFMKFYDIDGGAIKESHVESTNGNGHGALAGFLRSKGTDILICGGIGGGAKAALAECGIKLFCGVSGSADEAVNALLSGNLNYNPDTLCSHHGEGHTCSGHSCK